MNIPPFPSQDLAKLVLGYLAEEQLMTAYDEFLQASPYLDAFGNEYDRIFMTSLKNILAEYRAVKIYVETCKPFHLRKKLFQCSNLLEMVKFLIQHVDVNKIHIQENTQSKVSVEKQNINITANNCEVCKSLKLEVCTCTKSPQFSISSVQSRVSCETITLDSSVEATALSDLPGNHVRKKNIRTSDCEVTEVDATHNRLLPISNVVSEKNVSNSSVSSCAQLQMSQNNLSQNNNTMVKLAETLDLKHKEEFNKILNLVCHKNQSNLNSGAISQNINKQKMTLESYKNFATGVNSDSGSAIVPDSSTSENMHVHIPVSIQNSTTSSLEANKIKQTRTQYLLKVAHVKNATPPNNIVSISTVNNQCLPRLRPKPDESKIKILSDVKVDNSFNSSDATMPMPPVLKNATSTPLMQFQTVFINGTQVYKQKPFGQTYNYTKDEIMAMPTIILAPAPGPPPVSVKGPACSTVAPASNFTTAPISNSSRSLGPLVIDVASNSSSVTTKSFHQTTEVEKEKSEPKSDVVSKTFDITSASVPKDNIVTCATETSTPQVLPPLRKSSSTPRRSSHVRVLDFTTPRRILHESMNKCANTAAPSDVEVVISSSPNIHYPVPTEEDLNKDRVDVTTGSLKENSVNNKILGRKSNWDADLRALAVVSGEVLPKATPKPKTEKKKKDRKSLAATKEREKKDVEKLSTKKKTSKRKSSKKKNNPEPPEEKEIPIEPVNVTVKPTINIITDSDRVATVSDNDKIHNKSNHDNVDTPEMERMSLQHEIGVKLNISDLLETPYKQALYEIQMETPKFLGPDLPDDPISDIKIMNIPTPRFLNALTPSSYSSRPTDYSSGGSYYKPDEQDYMRMTDDICPVTSSIVTKDNIKSDVSCSIEIDSGENEKGNDKPSRPVRQCTKNVSYYKNLTINSKSKEEEDGAHSISSDTEDNSFCEIIIEEEIKSDTNKDNSSIKTQKRPHTKTSKKRKTPVKKEVSKSFMKIKPRRLTPTKKGSGKRKRRTPENSKVQTRKMATKRDDSNDSATPAIAPAPTKSRRKSSTPRKLHCTKTFNSESSGHDSPDLLSKAKETVSETTLVSTHDSDTEHLPLRWSDDGSQDSKPKEIESNSTEIEDINKIQEYLKTVTNDNDCGRDGRFHIDLVNRGFDLETAKIIERELLDTPDTMPELKSNVITLENNVESAKAETKNDSVDMEKTLDSDCSVINNLQIVQDEEEGDEIELSVHECNEDTVNYFAYNHDDTKDVPKRPLATLKDKFSMEVCLDDDLSIRLRATPFSLLLDQDPDEVLLNHNEQETEMAVRSISNIDKLYTPMKESLKAQCYEIFDSTLTSLDTPLKAKSPRNTDIETEVTVTEIVMEVEKIEEKEKFESKKRKRVQSGNVLDENESKKPKPEARYLLNSASIQNIDIESVLSKLHGP